MSDANGADMGGAPLPNKDLDRVAENLRTLAMEAGVTLPDVQARTAMSVYVGRGENRPPPQDLIRDLVPKLMVCSLRGNGLYRHGDRLVTIDDGTGKLRPMDAHRFVSWVPNTCGIVPFWDRETDKENGKEKLKVSSLTVDQAKLILASDELLVKMPEIVAVNMVPMPVWRNELDERGQEARKGFKKLAWLEPGYDKESKTFTVRTAPEIDFSMTLADAAEYLHDLFRWFPWSDATAARGSDRLAMHVALGVTCLARYLYAGKAPAFLYTSNLPGSGKGALIKAAMWPVFRRIGSSSLDSADKPELLKTLNTKASGGDPYIVADEMPQDRQINNQQIARFITERVWEFRGMGQDTAMKKCDITKTLMVFAGNRVTVDHNLNRRFIHVDLYPHESANERVLPEDVVLLGDPFFDDEANLNKLLSAYAALIRGWDEGGRGMTRDRPIESFEDWSKVVGSVVEYSGLGRPLLRIEVEGAGDDDSRAMKKLTALVIDRHCFTERDGKRIALDAAVVTMREIVAIARLHDLFTDKLGTVEMVVEELEGKRGWKWKEIFVKGDGIRADAHREPYESEKRLQAAGWMSQSVGSAWGKFWSKQAVDNQHRRSSCGVAYVFGDRAASKTSAFTLKRVVT